MAPKILEHRYVPTGAAKELFSRRDPEVLLSGPAGTGKSLACLQKLHLCALVNPNFRGIMLRKTATSLTSSALVTFRQHVAKAALEAGDVYWHGGSAVDPGQFRYANGSTITIGGMDRATRVMSSEYDMAYVQEATELQETDWEAITTRLRNNQMSFQQLIADCNPDTPTHWLKSRADSGRTVLLESRHRDNPTLYGPDGQKTATGAAYLAKLDALTGVRRLRLRDGAWAAAEGIIYEGFDAAVHVIDAPGGWPKSRRGRPMPPRDWSRFWVVDFGFVNPFVCQRWAEDPDGRLYLYAEHYRTKRLVEDHAADILAEVTAGDVGADGEHRWVEPHPVRIICDHDAEDRATLERHLKIGTQPAKKTVSDGIQAVAARLKVQADGKPRIFFLRDAVFNPDLELRDARKPSSTLQEMPGYVWKDSATKEEPLKVDDHGMDCMRYLVADRDLKGGYRIRVMDTRTNGEW